MTGDPAAKFVQCCAFFPADPVWTDQPAECSGVMIEVHLGDQVTYFCRRHLDQFGDMIIHTRRLKEVNV